MTLKGGEAFDLKGIVQGSPNKKERCQEMVEMPRVFISSFNSSKSLRVAFFFFILNAI